MTADKFQFTAVPSIRTFVELVDLNILIRTVALGIAFAGVVAHAVTGQALLLGLVVATLAVFAVAWVRE